MAQAGKLEPDLRSRTVMGAVWALSFAASLALFLIIIRPGLPVSLASIACGGILLLIALHDERTFLIPDRLVLLLCVLAAVFHALSDPHQLPQLAAAAAFAFGFLWLVGAAYKALRGQPGLGLGDAKLLGAAGLLLGAQGLLGTILWAVTTALALCAVLILLRRLAPDKGARVAFGSHLAFGAWMVWLWGPLLPGSG
jgi:leader peptidase (prepilin peptidase)/N-methyltransferase